MVHISTTLAVAALAIIPALAHPIAFDMEELSARDIGDVYQDIEAREPMKVSSLRKLGRVVKKVISATVTGAGAITAGAQAVQGATQILPPTEPAPVPREFFDVEDMLEARDLFGDDEMFEARELDSFEGHEARELDFADMDLEARDPQGLRLAAARRRRIRLARLARLRRLRRARLGPRELEFESIENLD